LQLFPLLLDQAVYYSVFGQLGRAGAKNRRRRADPLQSFCKEAAKRIYAGIPHARFCQVRRVKSEFWIFYSRKGCQRKSFY